MLAAVIPLNIHPAKVRPSAGKQPVIAAVVAAGGLEIFYTDTNPIAAGIQGRKALGPTDYPRIRTGQPWIIVELPSQVDI